MLEALVLSVLANVWLVWENQEIGELEQATAQLRQELKEQRDLAEQCYAKVKRDEQILIETERQRADAEAVAQDRAEQLEKLRNSNPTVDDYLDFDVPTEVVEYLKANNYD